MSGSSKVIRYEKWPGIFQQPRLGLDYAFSLETHSRPHKRRLTRAMSLRNLNYTILGLEDFEVFPYSVYENSLVKDILLHVCSESISTGEFWLVCKSRDSELLRKGLTVTVFQFHRLPVERADSIFSGCFGPGTARPIDKPEALCHPLLSCRKAG